MSHHAPAENNAATATKPITTLNPGCALPGNDGRRRNDNADKEGRDSSAVVSGIVVSGISRDCSKGSSATANSGSATPGSCNSIMAAGLAGGWASPVSRSEEHT